MPCLTSLPLPSRSLTLRLDRSIVQSIVRLIIHHSLLIIHHRYYSLASEFADHVGFEVWSKYPEEEFHGADDRMWEEDEWTAQVIDV